MLLYNRDKLGGLPQLAEQKPGSKTLILHASTNINRWNIEYKMAIHPNSVSPISNRMIFLGIEP